jgi:hypothetical protein
MLSSYSPWSLPSVWLGRPIKSGGNRSACSQIRVDCGSIVLERMFGARLAGVDIREASLCVS